MVKLPDINPVKIPFQQELFLVRQPFIKHLRHFHIAILQGNRPRKFAQN